MEQIIKDNFTTVFWGFLIFIICLYALSIWSSHLSRRNSQSNEEANFSALLGYIKFLLTITTACLGVMLGVFTVLFWGDKEELKKQSSDAIKQVRDSSNIKFMELENDVYAEVNRKLDKIFKSNEINNLVEKKARELAEKKVEKIVEEKTEKFDENLSVTLGIANAVNLMSEWKVEGMKVLVDIYKNNENDRNRIRALSALEESCDRIIKRATYYTSSYPQNQQDSIKNVMLERYRNNGTFMFYNDLLSTQNNLNLVNSLEGTEFNICDIVRFDEWANANGVPSNIQDTIPVFK